MPAAQLCLHKWLMGMTNWPFAEITALYTAS